MMRKLEALIGLVFVAFALLGVACGGDGNSGGDYSSAGGAETGDAATGADVETVVTLRTGIQFTLPVGWTKETPSSVMRQAQAMIPAVEGSEADPGELIVSHFGDAGGGVEENLARWIGQLDTPADSDPPQDSFSSGDFQITWVDVKGTLKADRDAGDGGTGSDAVKSYHRIFGAIVEGEGGPWFFRAGGPDETLAPQREAFVEVLRSIQGS